MFIAVALSSVLGGLVPGTEPGQEWGRGPHTPALLPCAAGNSPHASPNMGIPLKETCMFPHVTRGFLRHTTHT